MQLIEFKKERKFVFYPLIRTKDKIICKKMKRNEMFPESIENLSGFYEYNIENKSFKQLNRSDRKIVQYDTYEKSVEGESAITYLEKIRQLNHNTYILHKINLDLNEDEVIYSFDLDAKYDEVSVYLLDQKYFILFVKQTVYDFELELSLIQQQYGFDAAYLYDIENNEVFDIKDRAFSRGYNNALFKTTIDGVTNIVFEEFYLEVWIKRDEYFHNRGINRKNRIFTDCIKIIPTDVLIEEIIKGKENYSFEIIDSKGSSGSIMFEYAYNNLIYYTVEDFSTFKNVIIMYDIVNKSKKVIDTSFDDNDDMLEDDIIDEDIIYNFSTNPVMVMKQIEYKKFICNKFINNNKSYKYDNKIGKAKYIIDNRYIITGGRKNGEVSIIDTEADVLKKYNGTPAVLGNTVIIF